MSQEKLDHVVAGAIYDFMGFLTTRDEALTLGGVHDAAPAGDAIKEFLTIRVVDQECEPQIFDWAGRCSCLNINDKERELHVPPPINGE